MKISNAVFMCSSERTDQCPTHGLREFAFIGRSNVGKSSLINKLTNISGLAKVSGQPGKTRLINHFKCDERWVLVDLPGYGYAKVSKASREIFGRMIRHYILNREELYCLFVLVDIRLEPQENDLKFLDFLGENSIPFAIVFTKADKLSATAVKKSVENYGTKLNEVWDELPPFFVTSAESGRGKEELLEYIEKHLD